MVDNSFISNNPILSQNLTATTAILDRVKPKSLLRQEDPWRQDLRESKKKNTSNNTTNTAAEIIPLSPTLLPKLFETFDSNTNQPNQPNQTSPPSLDSNSSSDVWQKSPQSDSSPSDGQRFSNLDKNKPTNYQQSDPNLDLKYNSLVFSAPPPLFTPKPENRASSSPTYQQANEVTSLSPSQLMSQFQSLLPKSPSDNLVRNTPFQSPKNPSFGQTLASISTLSTLSKSLARASSFSPSRTPSRTPSRSPSQIPQNSSRDDTKKAISLSPLFYDTEWPQLSPLSPKQEQTSHVQNAHVQNAYVQNAYVQNAYVQNALGQSTQALKSLNIPNIPTVKQFLPQHPGLIEMKDARNDLPRQEMIAKPLPQPLDPQRNKIVNNINNNNQCSPTYQALIDYCVTNHQCQKLKEALQECEKKRSQLQGDLVRLCQGENIFSIDMATLPREILDRIGGYGTINLQVNKRYHDGSRVGEEKGQDNSNRFGGSRNAGNAGNVGNNTGRSTSNNDINNEDDNDAYPKHWSWSMRNRHLQQVVLYGLKHKLKIENPHETLKQWIKDFEIDPNIQQSTQIVITQQGRKRVKSIARKRQKVE